MATLYDAPVFWILWKLRFWSCASLSFIRTKVVWYICSQSGTFKAIFRYYETSYNLHKSRDKNLTWVTDFEKQIVADRSRPERIGANRIVKRIGKRTWKEQRYHMEKIQKHINEWILYFEGWKYEIFSGMNHELWIINYESSLVHRMILNWA